MYNNENEPSSLAIGLYTCTQKTLPSPNTRGYQYSKHIDSLNTRRLNTTLNDWQRNYYCT